MVRWQVNLSLESTKMELKITQMVAAGLELHVLPQKQHSEFKPNETNKYVEVKLQTQQLGNSV